MKNMNLNFFNQLSYTPYKWREISNQKAFAQLIKSALNFFFYYCSVWKKKWESAKIGKYILSPVFDFIHENLKNKENKASIWSFCGKHK